MTDEIDIVGIIDRTIDDCLKAKIPPLPSVIAGALARVLCQKKTEAEIALCFADLILLVRERVEVFAGMSDFVN
jgi:hypothetical protein